MRINGQNLVEKGIIIPNNMGKSAQAGYDVTLKDVRKIKMGIIRKEGTSIQNYEDVEKSGLTKETWGWVLKEGVYSLTFHQGVKLGPNHVGQFVHRSSILRSSALITSGQFDPGFECKEAGATMIVFNRIVIEEGARVAQFIVEECELVKEEHLYNGKYQGDKDLK